MDNNVTTEVKKIIINSVNASLSHDEMPDDFPLAGNILDSMAVTNLIIALEEHFGFTLDDEELSAEDFETIISLSKLVEQKLHSSNA